MSAAAIAAARRRRRIAEAMRQEEEEMEEMAGYHPNDLSDGWEFKILRSVTGTFKDPGRMRAILEEERKAGWTLVEKFDNGRIRLKRPAGAAALDAKLDFDPYRTYVDQPQGCAAPAILVTLLGILLSGLIVGLVGR
jgi:hypothetical protein